MTPELRQDYLKTLGIPEFLYAADERDNEITALATCLVVVESEQEHSFCQSGQSYDFLEKMLGAIGLSMSDVKCVSATNSTLSSVIEDNPAKAVLIMDKALKSTIGQTFTTCHPYEIISNPALKREAWEVLKEVKKCLK
jgi:hypothetical protein